MIGRAKRMVAQNFDNAAIGDLAACTLHDHSFKFGLQRCQSRKAAFNLCLFRRAATSFAIYWIQRQRNKRAATTSGFYEAMAAKGARKAFSLVTVKYPSWLPPK